jgi:uncharacterized protein (DUF2141 family)
MKSLVYNIGLLFVLGILVFNCANRGNPTGGDKDIEVPKIIRSTPDNYTVNFKDNEISIYFNEYVKFKNLSKQLIISPPMEYEPEITPYSTASKVIKIKIKDTLQPNTTYSLNFGNSIVDNNEENPFPFFKYVFSTGTYIDSLKIHGKVFDALDRETEKNVLVNLYEVDSTYSDSIVYKQKPRYMTNTQDSVTTFTIENIKAGSYKLVALKDNNEDNKFQQNSDKIAFYDDIITVGQDSAYYELKLFKEALDTKVMKPKLVSGEKISIGFEGAYKTISIAPVSTVPEGFETRIIKEQEKDSLLYFYKPKLEVDSLMLRIAHTKKIDTFKVRIKDNRRDTLTITSLNNGKLSFDDDFRISSNIPFTAIDESKIKIIDKDSVVVTYKTELDSLNNTYKFKFPKKEANRYVLDALPEAFTDFFGRTNDSLNFKVSTDKYASFGNIRVMLQNETYPLFIQFVDAKSEVVYSKYVTEKGKIDFTNLNPGTYYLRVLFDENNNGVYDSGNYLKGEQPERVSYAEKIVEVRASFDEITNFKLD